MISEVKEIDTRKSGDCAGKYIPVRVVVQVDKPLRRILRVDVMRDGKESVMLLQYERLPEHCFRCGRLCHVVRDCLEAIIVDGPEDFYQLFGTWLKAESLVKLDKFRQKREGSRYEDDKNTPGIMEGVLLGNNDSTELRHEASGGIKNVWKENDAAVVETAHVEKGNEYCHARKNLGDVLANKELNPSLPKKLAEYQISDRQLRKGEKYCGFQNHSGLGRIVEADGLVKVHHGLKADKWKR
ncbi:hypothetical protein Dsin_030308 [Dipteronia sinensis]|uniref:CCHC-type domain-containing protein n=1 Tax=Dipteronia sinensis TaxID=43782 RepID=A0AAD9ZJC1_9ROSI|nr:hypothetical protein Dsin_030308 [Dipteronia sinensis]